LTELKHVSPVIFLGINVGLAAMIPLAWFCIRVVHGMRPRWLSSVVPKIRWRFFFACLGPAVVALIVQLVVGSLVPGGDSDMTGTLKHFTASTATFALVVLLTTPLQAAGEEYLFRGYGMMAVGSLFPRSREQLGKWVAIGVTAVLFALAHGSQNFPLFFDRLGFGLVAAWLVTRTGGIEAGLALHVLNNFLAFGFALAFGDLGDALSVTDASWWQIVVTLAQSAVFAVLVVLLARKMGVQNRTRPPAPEAGTAPVGQVANA
jgi:membrane protease YdiL (CAAX protease family)